MAAAAAAMRLRVGGRALLRRTPAAHLAPNRTCTPEQIRDAAARAAQIDQTKEQLFDMVNDLVSTHDVPHKMNRQYLLLMQRLSSQIQPRPHDPVWRVYRRTERDNTFYKFLGVGTYGILGAIASMPCSYKYIRNQRSCLLTGGTSYLVESSSCRDLFNDTEYLKSSE